MEKIQYSISFAKVDKEHRIVSGFATLNNVDKQDEIVTTEASVKAFSEFRGNIREQHTKIAAGKMLSFGVEKFFDKVANKVYDGVFVKAYISKGAQDTWEKVLDGTLSGFSIGGIVKDWEVLEEGDKKVTVIKEYELHELSLVDNPANPLANVVAIEKMDNFFSQIEKEQNMENIEKSDDVVETSVSEPEAVVEEEVEAVIEEAPTAEEAVAVDEVAETVVPEAEAVVETEEVSSDANVLDDAVAGIKALLDEQKASTTEAFNLIIEQLKDLKSGVESANSKVDTVTSDLASVKTVVSEFDKRVDAVERDTAVRKSGDHGEVVQGITEKTNQSVWGGRFLAADL